MVFWTLGLYTQHYVIYSHGDNNNIVNHVGCDRKCQANERQSDDNAILLKMDGHHFSYGPPGGYRVA